MFSASPCSFLNFHLAAAPSATAFPATSILLLTEQSHWPRWHHYGRVPLLPTGRQDPSSVGWTSGSHGKPVPGCVLGAAGRCGWASRGRSHLTLWHGWPGESCGHAGTAWHRARPGRCQSPHPGGGGERGAAGGWRSCWDSFQMITLTFCCLLRILR